MEYKDPGRYIPIIYLLYSWGSRFGVPSRVPLLYMLLGLADAQAAAMMASCSSQGSGREDLLRFNPELRWLCVCVCSRARWCSGLCLRVFSAAYKTLSVSR